MPAKKRGADGAAPGAKKKKGGGGGGNDELADAFADLAKLELMAASSGDDKSRWAAAAYKKVAAAIRAHKSPITTGKEAGALPGVGKQSALKAEEFINTGKISRLEELREEMGDALGALKSATKKKPLSAAEKKSIAQAVEEAMELSVAALKEELKQNRQKTTGNKTDLSKRVGEGRVLGATPKCPGIKGTCGLGFLAFNPDTGVYTCPGGFDDDKFVPCGFSSGEVKREKWVGREEGGGS
eukprot:Hpha_TRINITY_DN10330_c0_g1::TRINITY_DN10330_c0_g1_i1::g.116088::m.116088